MPSNAHSNGEHEHAPPSDAVSVSTSPFIPVRVRLPIVYAEVLMI